MATRQTNRDSLASLIESRRTDEPNAQQAAEAESRRRSERQQRAERSANKVLWIEHHYRLARTFSRLAVHHRRVAEALAAHGRA